MGIREVFDLIEAEDPKNHEIEYVHIRVDIGAKHPYVITHCHVIDPDNRKDQAIGTSICSFRDQWDRKKGNRIARNRAYTALKEKKNSSPIREYLIDTVLSGGIGFKSLYLGDR